MQEGARSFAEKPDLWEEQGIPALVSTGGGWTVDRGKL